MEHTKEQVNNIFQSLPVEIKTAILSVETFDSIVEISQKHQLHLDQQSTLGQETGNILLGISDPLDFVSTISTKLGIDKNIANQIVGEINEKIFSKVKDSLRNIHNAANKKEVPVSPVPVAPNLIKNTETQNLNVPQKTLDVLQGKGVVTEQKHDTSILGFSVEKIADKPTNILSQKMNGSFNMPKNETENGTQKITDPYLESI
ncbi:MAG: hypothetical protein WCO84_03845 [bacterium]